METDEIDLIFLISLSRISFLNRAEKIALSKKIDGADALSLLSVDEIGAIVGRNIRGAWNGRENVNQAKIEAAIIEAKGINTVLYDDCEYPALLKEIPNAPFAVFYRGDISCLQGKTVSVVGTRCLTADGKKAAHDFAYSAVCDGCTVVSGLARGADRAAHLGAVDAWFDALEKDAPLPAGKTVAVLPCGIDTVTPFANMRLSCDIIKSGGCILSEYVPGTPAANWRFVQRNRIIAALSPATVVIQAPTGSGALITAGLALEYDRDVVFHSAAFSEAALATDEAIVSRLKHDFAQGKISRGKIENSCRKYKELGAPTIENYEDYCKCLAEMPGLRSLNSEQMEMF